MEEESHTLQLCLTSHQHRLCPSAELSHLGPALAQGTHLPAQIMAGQATAFPSHLSVRTQHYGKVFSERATKAAAHVALLTLAVSWFSQAVYAVLGEENNAGTWFPASPSRSTSSFTSKGLPDAYWDQYLGLPALR